MLPSWSDWGTLLRHMGLNPYKQVRILLQSFSIPVLGLKAKNNIKAVSFPSCA